MDRASDFESAGWGFESLRVRLSCGGLRPETATITAADVLFKYKTSKKSLVDAYPQYILTL